MLLNLQPNYPLRSVTSIFHQIGLVGSETNPFPLQCYFFSRLRVLIVDNYPDICELFALVLQEIGAEVTTANTCAKALTYIEENPPDLIISEIFLPNENGLTLIRKARELADKVDHPLLAIAVTSYTDLQEQLEICSAGFQRCLSKPIDVYELIATVVDLVEQQKSS